MTTEQTAEAATRFDDDTVRRQPIYAPGYGTCRCGSWWTGASRAHCGACHRTFSTTGNFDRHRVGGGNERRCANPEERGLLPRQKTYGVLYGQPGTETPEAALAWRERLPQR